MREEAQKGRSLFQLCMGNYCVTLNKAGNSSHIGCPTSSQYMTFTKPWSINTIIIYYLPKLLCVESTTRGKAEHIKYNEIMINVQSVQFSIYKSIDWTRE